MWEHISFVRDSNRVWVDEYQEEDPILDDWNLEFDTYPLCCVSQTLFCLCSVSRSPPYAGVELGATHAMAPPYVNDIFFSPFVILLFEILYLFRR